MNHSTQQSVEIELSSKGSNLYIFFGGISAGIAMPPFEFYNASKIIDENKIFVRDFSQSWYQSGLYGISDNVNSTAGYLKKKIKEINPEKTFFVGNSMGGYAAILFGNLIGNGEIIAFSPQTFISPELRSRHRDFRWNEQIKATYRRSISKNETWDLFPLLLRLSKNIKTSIYVSKEDRLDHIHALHLKDVQCTKLIELERGGHNLVKTLRDQGILPAIMSGTYT